MGHLIRTANTYNNLSFHYGLLGLYHRALAYGREAMAISRPRAYRAGLTFQTGNTGHALAGLGRLDEAKEYYQESLALASYNFV